MTEEMKKYLHQLLMRVDGLYCILVTDRDGVPVIKVANEKTPELAMRPSFLSTFAMAADQGGKLGLGKHKTLICMYSTYQVVQVNRLPLVITLIASETANTGLLLALEPLVEPLLSDLRGAVGES
ncbi:hypothetical protein R5R35_009126 [Gryllus longicercus]|uniref:Ragulator complex protein LAMTOR3 n=1 Tax=Gryllus longicercus TaxID=2509291 RepID=A0AAN9ZCW7_9ORTH|nr:Ragulator complex protein LAMTOR3 homolog [Gryllus bimaculatus]